MSQQFQKGYYGPEVLDMKQRLADLGYNSGYLDENFDETTEQVLMEFQQNSGLQVTGIYDQSTRECLESSASPPSEQPTPYDSTGGQEGDSVGTQKVATDLDVALVPQPTDCSCWAASLTMLVSFRDQTPYVTTFTTSWTDFMFRTSWTNVL